MHVDTSPSIVQVGLNLAQGCTITCQMMFAPCALPIWFEIFKKSCQNSNLGFHFAKHVPKSILASCKAQDGVMVHHIVTTKQHLDQPESFIRYSQTPTSNHSLTKPSKIHN